MKKFLFAIACLGFIVACKGPQGEKAEVGDAQDVAENTEGSSAVLVNTSSSQITWIGYKPGDDHNGTIAIKEGSVSMKDGEIESGSFVIDLTTITSTDPDMDEENNGKLTGHLRSSDFFNVDTNATASFDITKVTKLTGSDLGSHTINGNLTLNGMTNNVSFPANVTCTGNVCVTKAEFNIDRTDWGIQFMSKKVLGDLADRFVNDEVTIGLNIVSGS